MERGTVMNIKKSQGKQIKDMAQDTGQMLNGEQMFLKLMTQYPNDEREWRIKK